MFFDWKVQLERVQLTRNLEELNNMLKSPDKIQSTFLNKELSVICIISDSKRKTDNFTKNPI